MITTNFSLILFYLLAFSSIYCIQPMPSDIHQPTQFIDTLPLRELERIDNHTFSHSLSKINYEINSRMYFKKGNIPEEHVHNHQYYTIQPDLNPIKPFDDNNTENETNPCSLFPTTLETDWDTKLLLNHKVSQLIFLPAQYHHEFNESIHKVVGYLFTYLEKQKNIAVIEVSVFGFDPQKPFQYQSSKIQVIKNLDVKDLQEGNFKMFDLDNQFYLVKQKTMYWYKIIGHKTLELSGQVTINEDTRGAGFMKKNAQNQIIFFVANVKGIEIYQINQNTLRVNKIGDFSETFEQSKINLYSATYDSLYQRFYITAENSLYALSGNTSKMQITEAYELNGTCKFNGKYQSTMHLICEYKRIVYGMQLHFNDHNVTLNRYYTDWDIQGIKEMVNVGHQKMVIIGSDSFLLQGYAINRNILLELGKYQPFDVVRFVKGKFIAPIPMLSSPMITTLLTISEASQLEFSITILKQDGPQLFCNFQEDQQNLEYSVLLEFNVTNCKTQPLKSQSSLDAFCTILQPYRIKNTRRSKYIQPKNANIISGIILICGVIIGIIVVGLGVLVIKRLSIELDTVKEKTKQAKLKKASKQLRKINQL